MILHFFIFFYLSLLFFPQHKGKTSPKRPKSYFDKQTSKMSCFSNSPYIKIIYPNIASLFYKIKENDKDNLSYNCLRKIPT